MGRGVGGSMGAAGDGIRGTQDTYRGRRLARLLQRRGGGPAEGLRATRRGLQRGGGPRSHRSRKRKRKCPSHCQFAVANRQTVQWLEKFCLTVTVKHPTTGIS